MRMVSTTGEPAIVSFGQFAFGIFAFGQFARGFIAVGQVAVGVFVLGQCACSVVGLGQTGIGLFWFTGMLGVGGRGLCLRLVPALDVPRTPPLAIAIDDLLANRANGGAVLVQIADGANGRYLTLPNGAPLPAKPTPGVVWALQNQANEQLRVAYANVRREGQLLVCDALVEKPGERRNFDYGWAVLRFVALVAAATAWWYFFSVMPAPTH